MIILGIAGKAGSGKDTVCDYLVGRYGFRKVSLAAPLKEMVSRVFPKIPHENLWGPSNLRNEPVKAYRMSGECPTCGNPLRLWPDADPLERYTCFDCHAKWPEYLSARVALQTLGTDWGRRLYPDVWVDHLFAHLPEDDHRNLCISDVRFPNEVRAIVRNGGKVVRVARPTGTELPASAHESETALDGVGAGLFDGTIDNDSTKDALYESVDRVLAGVLRTPS